MKGRRKLMLIGLLFAVILSHAQDIAINPALLNGSWPASWITKPDAAQREYGIYHFRKHFSLPAVPPSFVVHLSADNRYRLFVNGQPVCSGPARGDLFNWYFESLDIARYLKQGENVIAAEVWNMGALAPVAQISNQTGFVMQGNTPAEALVNTDASWKVLQNKAYSPTSLDNGERLSAYMVVGPGDQVKGDLYPWGWEMPGYDDASWSAAKSITQPVPVGYGTDNLWTLKPRNIPLFTEHISRFSSIRRSTDNIASAAFLTGKQPIKISAHQSVKILLDHGVNCIGYPELQVTGGKGALIKLTYAEALVDKDRNKGNRNEIDGKEIIGNYDEFIADGGIGRKFRPLWLRTYRYVEMEISTKDEALVINDFYGMMTGYPLEMKASFSSSDPSLEEIWNVGWRTAQLCAGDLYYDCPYYEQLQYTGDSRIQALISLYLTGDDRLMRKAILDFYHSRTAEGLTQGRYPSNRLQIIPPFSLFWVSMIHDYWMHKRDDEFVRQFLPAINEVMSWYVERTDVRTGMLGPMKWWNFTDWDNFDGWGVAPGAADGGAAIISLQAAYTMNQAADLFSAFGKTAEGSSFLNAAEFLRSATYRKCYDPVKGLLGDTPDQSSFSQHAGIWAILSGAIKNEEAKEFMQRLLADQSIGQVTFFYRFYLTQAMKKAGIADQYYGQLSPWRKMLALGLTTFAEKPEPARSDCHAWSASPDYDFLSTICGIMPDAPGFKRVRIAPALAGLKWIKGCMPHPDGMISVAVAQHAKDSGIKATVVLPEKLEGVFVWMGKEIKLHGGKQELTL